jgi:lipoprotein-releasing system permease protein
MNTELFIAKRIYKGDKKNEKRVSSPAIKIAIAGIALGLAVMIVAVCIIIGFKKEIREKVVGFEAHIQITAFDNTSFYEYHPISFSDTLACQLMSHPETTIIKIIMTHTFISSKLSQLNIIGLMSFMDRANNVLPSRSL